MFKIFEAYILCFTENLLCNLLFSCFFVPRKNSLRHSMHIIVFLNVLTTLLSISNIKNQVIKLFFAIILFSFIFYIIYNTNIIYIITASIAYVALILCVETPFYIFIPLIVSQERINVISENYFLLTIIGLTVKLFGFVVILFICRIFGKKGYLKYLNKKDWCIYLSVPLFSMFVLFALVFYDVSILSVIVAVVMLLFNTLFYNYLQQNGLKNKKMLEIVALEERNKSQIKAFQDIERIYGEQKKQIHEFKNQINFINGLIDGGDFNTLKKYVNNIKESIDSDFNEIETGNLIINILINDAIKKARQKQISFMLDISVNEKINMEDNDLVIILSNLLNNAIEYCETLRHSSKIITFKLDNTKTHLLIMCSNPIETSILVENNIIQTTKSDSSNHGFGLQNILQAVQKYKGDVSISTSDNKYKYLVLINYMER